MIVVPIRALASVSTGPFGAERPLGVLATARFASVDRGCALSRATTPAAATTPTTTTSASALLAVTTFTIGLSGGSLCCPVTVAVLTFGRSLIRAAGCRCVDTVSDVVVAVGFATGTIARFRAISVDPVGIPAIAVSVAAMTFAAPTLASMALGAVALAALALMAMALAFRTSLSVATLWRTLASILITASVATTLTITTATAAPLHALPAVTSLAPIAAAVTSITAVAPITSITSRIRMSMTARMLASPIASSITTRGTAASSRLGNRWLRDGLRNRCRLFSKESLELPPEPTAVCSYGCCSYRLRDRRG